MALVLCSVCLLLIFYLLITRGAEAVMARIAGTGNANSNAEGIKMAQIFLTTFGIVHVLVSISLVAAASAAVRGRQRTRESRSLAVGMTVAMVSSALCYANFAVGLVNWCAASSRVLPSHLQRCQPRA